MAHETYIVAQDRGEWEISFHGLSLGRFASRPNAIRVAVESAHGHEGSTGWRQAEVVVELRDCERYAVWTSGKDGFSK
jgi:hypothetical protein